MRELLFTKMVATGNDFVVIDCRGMAPREDACALAEKLCHRQYGIGADGLLLIEDTDTADMFMRIINPDGTEVAMCGNGIRCAARFFADTAAVTDITIDTPAGMHRCTVNSDEVTVVLPDPTDILLNQTLDIDGTVYDCHMINTGVPHVVMFIDQLASCDVVGLGRAIRFHKNFAPAGTNANFVQVLASDRLAVRTYERGVEAETLACGTGSMAAATIAGLIGRCGEVATPVIDVVTASREVLKISYTIDTGRITGLGFTGNAHLVFKGVIQLS